MCVCVVIVYSVTCTAGVGTFIVEFGALSRLTGDPIYEEVAMNAIYSLTKYISSIGLYGNHIDVQTGRWTGMLNCYLNFLKEDEKKNKRKIHDRKLHVS